MPELAAIVPAAGISTRYGRKKLLEELDGQTVLQRALLALWNHEFINEIFVATSDDAIIDVIRELPARPSKEIHICPGGLTRAHSVLSALRQVPSEYEWVAVHDAARPLLSVNLIDTVLRAAVEHGAAAPALPVALTVKQASGPLPARVQRTVPREMLWGLQTPQIMRRADLLHAFDNSPVALDTITDDLQLLELAGKEVWLVPGDERNLKITTPADLELARLHLNNSQ